MWSCWRRLWIKGRDRYENASEWIADLAPRLSGDAAIRDARAHPLVERLFIGGLKNLLATLLNGIAMVNFVLAGAIAWEPGAVMVASPEPRRLAANRIIS